MLGALINRVPKIFSLVLARKDYKISSVTQISVQQLALLIVENN